jgi:hypothetical protein
MTGLDLEDLLCGGEGSDLRLQDYTFNDRRIQHGSFYQCPARLSRRCNRNRPTDRLLYQVPASIHPPAAILGNAGVCAGVCKISVTALCRR